MKTYQTIWKLLMVGLIVVACENHDYPKHLYFDRNGGTQTIYGNDCVYGLSIQDWQGVGKSSVSIVLTDSIRVDYDWLSARAVGVGDITAINKNAITITAAPNTTNKKRRLIVRGMVDNSFAETIVTQDK
ncbi:MAG: hypothetical protein HUK02_00495 [Bacteroidaceae bacterium]|nr:hypothetical protein [Bacteroidaceae bacterium]